MTPVVAHTSALVSRVGSTYRIGGQDPLEKELPEDPVERLRSTGPRMREDRETPYPKIHLLKPPGSPGPSVFPGPRLNERRGRPNSSTQKEQGILCQRVCREYTT